MIFFTMENRFLKSILIPSSAPQDLICEECEKNISVIYCARCNEVFCMFCAELTHPVPYAQINHPHESKNVMRAVENGDKSNVIINTTYYLPDNEIHQEDYLKIKDLSIPSSLCTSHNQLKPTKSTYLLPKYNVNEMILFTDPHSEQESYGKIISQWDFKLSNVAPAILRGDGAIVYYIVKLLGFTKHIAHLSMLLREPSIYVDKLNNMVTIKGVEKDALIDGNKRAHIIDRRIADLQGLRKLGPKYHLRDVASHHYSKNAIIFENREFGNEEDDFSNTSMTSMSRNSLLYPVNRNRRIRLGTQNEFIESHQEDFQSFIYNGIDLNLYADIDTDVQSQLSANNLHRNPLPAYARSYESLIAQSDVLEYSYGAALMDHNHNPSSNVASSAEDNLLQMLLNHRNDDNQSIIQSQSMNSTSKSQLALNEREEEIPSSAYQQQQQSMQLCLKILVLSEADICSVVERLREQFNSKFSRMQKMMLRFQSSDVSFIKLKNFIKWKDTITYDKSNELRIAATKIQALIRMFLCKDKIAEKIKYYNDLEKEKWKNVHSKYRYSNSLDSKAKTMNKVIYFETLNELNKYAAFLRVCVLRVIKFLERKRAMLLISAMKLWKSIMATAFLESDIQSRHIHDECVDAEISSLTNRGNLFLARQRLNIAKDHFNMTHNPDMYIDEYSYDTILSKPLRVPMIISKYTNQRSFDEEPMLHQQLHIESDIAKWNDIHLQIVPSYIPSENMTIPDLLPIYLPISADDRLHLRNDRRLNYCLFRDKMRGPTHDSNWVIPHVLLMGSIPCSAHDEDNTKIFSQSRNLTASGIQDMHTIDTQQNNNVSSNEETATSDQIIKKAAYKFQTNSKAVEKVSAVSMLLLTGIDYFISLLEENEENFIDESLGIEPIKVRIESSLKKASIDVGKIVSFCNEIITKQQAQIDAIPPYGKTDPRYPRAYREKLRCKARIQVASDNMKKAKLQIKNLAPEVDWLRIPFKIDGTGTNPNQIMPHIWLLEDLIRQGRKLYIYSGDGHGRSGMICGILLGRLYNLHSYEALYRVQACHDSSLREIKREYPVNCPQLPNQRNLLVQILNNTNLLQDTEITIRTQIDPETFLDQANRRPLLFKTNKSEQSYGTILTTNNDTSKSKEIVKKNAINSRSRSSYQILDMEQALKQRNELAAQMAIDLEQGNNKEVMESEEMFNNVLRSDNNKRTKNTTIAVKGLSNSVNTVLLPSKVIQTVSTSVAQPYRSGITIRGAAGILQEERCRDSKEEGNGNCQVLTINNYSNKSNEQQSLLNLPDLFDHSVVHSLKQSVDLIRKLPKKRQEPAIRPLLPLIRSSATNQSN